MQKLSKKIPFKIKNKLRRAIGILKGNKFVRKILTNNSTRLAIGECHHYLFPERYLKLDYKNSDFDFDLNNFTKLPFKDNSFTVITLYHILEHLNDDSGERLLKECLRVLKKNGGLRIEVPDLDLFLKAYDSDDRVFLDYFKKNRLILTKKYGFSKMILEDHISVVGEMASYINNSIPGIHIPAYCTKAQFDDARSNGLEELNKLAQSKTTKDQKKSFGHNNAFNFSKLNRILNKIGFSEIKKQKRNITSIDNLKLGKGIDSLICRVNEKKHREFFSLYVDAIK